ncbi:MULTISPECIES: hypothetical protein [Actinoalloteichus]|uniref:hypothetical protein n=1 Tax=Actinoalloteichus TaxID=65496 RepID=UPI00095296A9|nr:MULTISPECIES: hypothetical protein [Actinoalloteichus]
MAAAAAGRAGSRPTTQRRRGSLLLAADVAEAPAWTASCGSVPASTRANVIAGQGGVIPGRGAGPSLRRTTECARRSTSAFDAQAAG